MATLAQFRSATRAMLEAALSAAPYEVDYWVDGKVESSENLDALGCVWSVGFSEAPIDDNVQLEALTLHARVFRRYSQEFDSEVPAISPEPFEEILEAIQAAFKVNQTALGPWYARVTEGEIDLERQMVEVRIMGMQQNPGVPLV